MRTSGDAHLRGRASVAMHNLRTGCDIEFLGSFEPREVLIRRFEFPLKDFAVMNSEFRVNAIAQIDFICDRSKKGAIIIDDMSFTNAN